MRIGDDVSVSMFSRRRGDSCLDLKFGGDDEVKMRATQCPPLDWPDIG